MSHASKQQEKPKYHPVTHVIFDMDGLLLDSERYYEEIIAEIAGKYGKKYTTDVKMKILGTPEPMTSKLAVELMDLPITPQEFLTQMKAGVVEKLQEPPLMPGAESVVRHFHKHRIPIALATSSSESATAIKTSHYKELFNLFHHKVMGSTDSEVKRGKPFPDIFLVCASRFDDPPDPSKCLVFEDAPNGVHAAKAAGMQVIMVPAPTTARELCADATIVIDSLEKVKPELFGLPRYSCA